MKSWVLLGFLFFGVWAQAQVDTCEAQFNDYIQSKRDLGVFEKHLPQMHLGDPQRQRPTVLFIHGIFESPHYFTTMNEEMGRSYNTLSILLPGHWEGDVNSIDKVSYKDWLNEVEKTIKIAQCFNPHIIFAGQSLGGLLAMNAAIEHPDLAVGLVVWVPAVQMKVLPNIASSLGALLRLDGNFFLHTPPDHDDVAKISPNGGIQIYELIQHIGEAHGDPIPQYAPNEARPDQRLSYVHVYEHIQVPVFLAVAENDPGVSMDELQAMRQQVKTRVDYLYYPKISGVWHGNIVKAQQDAYLSAPFDINVDFENMSARVLRFMNSLTQP